MSSVWAGFHHPLRCRLLILIRLLVNTIVGPIGSLSLSLSLSLSPWTSEIFLSLSLSLSVDFGNYQVGQPVGCARGVCGRSPVAHCGRSPDLYDKIFSLLAVHHQFCMRDDEQARVSHKIRSRKPSFVRAARMTLTLGASMPHWRRLLAAPKTDRKHHHFFSLSNVALKGILISVGGAFEGGAPMPPAISSSSYRA